MNRAARRRFEREFTPGERAAWRENMATFSEATQGVAQAVVVLPRDQQTLAGAAEAGNVTACAVMTAIEGWFDAAEAQAKPALCLACPTAFRGGVNPGGFVILMPFAADPSCAIATGICAHCANCSTRDNLLATAIRQWRRLWPALHPIQGGRA